MRQRFARIAAPLPLLLGGCGPSAPPPASEALISAPPLASPAGVPRSGEVKTDANAKVPAVAPLTPLATPQQVIGAFTTGINVDPFGSRPLALPGTTAASQRPGGSRPRPVQPPLQLPKGFSVSGVIRSGDVSEAVVSYGDLSGSVRPGDYGGRTTDLLPFGWSVAAIDVHRGLLTLQKGGQRVTAEL